MNISSHDYFSNGVRNENLSKDLVEKYNRIRIKTISHNCYPVLTLKHLSLLTETDYFFLRRVVSGKQFAYHRIEHLKADGTVRNLYSPILDLKIVQRWILDFILSSVENSSSSYAYENGKSIFDAAEKHIGNKWMLKIDLRNFFDSIDEISIYKIFNELGYSEILSFEFSRLCTIRRKRTGDLNIPSKLPYAPRNPGHLPQGAPTSGQLANIFLKNFDKEIELFSINNDLIYTRYSDDLIFSSNKIITGNKASIIINKVSTEALKLGLEINSRKTILIPPGKHKKVLGLIVDSHGVHVPKKYVSDLKWHIRQSDLYGVLEYSQQRGFQSPEGFINFINGNLSFIKAPNPVLYNSLKRRWSNIIQKYRISQGIFY
ncbi:reverse transcriptase family protein [Rothia sp. P5764]|uniref:reverse transcriptase family protein n=1 Tax=Rothia sp. P5764 TaxID=3402654 RepID=UPI003AD62D93